MDVKIQNAAIRLYLLAICHLHWVGVICSVTDVAILHSFSLEHIVGYELQWFDDSKASQLFQKFPSPNPILFFEFPFFLCLLMVLTAVGT